jgi:hypothetical protein
MHDLLRAAAQGDTTAAERCPRYAAQLAAIATLPAGGTPLDLGDTRAIHVASQLGLRTREQLLLALPMLPECRGVGAHTLRYLTTAAVQAPPIHAAIDGAVQPLPGEQPAYLLCFPASDVIVRGRPAPARRVPVWVMPGERWRYAMAADAADDPDARGALFGDVPASEPPGWEAAVAACWPVARGVPHA